MLGSLVEAFEILSKGANVIMEYRAFRISVMVLREDDLLLRISTAHGRAVAVAALDDLP